MDYKDSNRYRFKSSRFAWNTTECNTRLATEYYDFNDLIKIIQ